jgi:PAS domain S-box-containing protein
MNASWNLVIFTDTFGSILTLGIALWCAFLAREWTQKKPDDIFRHYIYLLTLAIVFFAISRSFGHLVKQILLMTDRKSAWEIISPFSGAINSATFVVIFAFGIYFHRFQKVHIEVEKYRNNLEEMIEKRTRELEETNISLAGEISERKHAERALKESKGYLQAILDNTTLPIFLKDIAGNYILINKEYERLAQITNEEIIGKNDFDVFPDPVATTFQAQDAEVRKNDAALQFEETIPLKDGGHTFLTSKFPLRDEGIIYAIGGVCTDITSRKAAENKLAAEQERLAVTLRSIGDGVITTDTAGHIVLLNKVAEQLTGWSQQEALGKPLEEVFHLSTRGHEQHQNPVETVLYTGQSFTFAEQTVLVSRQGQELFIADSGAPIRDNDSNIIGVVLVFRDVTHQLKLEAESLKAKKLESVGVLAGGIAHDFNNILAAILGNINLARLDAGLGEETQKLLADAEKASLRAKDLTRQLLTFAKGGAPVKETSSLQEVIQDSAIFVLHGENVACHYEFPDDLWLVDIDKGQISQVIQNIIINANHAMPNGGVINITCENIDASADPQLSFDGYHVKISISDNGIGIPAEAIDKIFDPYYSTKSDGSGLGLAICHSIIIKHNGYISVQSRAGIGSTFTLYLPRSEKTTIQKQEELVVKKAKSLAKILVMDDEQMVRDVAEKMLVRLGHAVVLAADGEEALHLFTESMNSGRPFDLIIMDLTIPGGMGGQKAVQEMLRFDPQAKVIVSSGYSNDPILANFKEYGFCSAIVKPYQLLELSRVISQFID